MRFIQGRTRTTSATGRMTLSILFMRFLWDSKLKQEGSPRLATHILSILFMRFLEPCICVLHTLLYNAFNSLYEIQIYLRGVILSIMSPVLSILFMRFAELLWRCKSGGVELSILFMRFSITSNSKCHDHANKQYSFNSLYEIPLNRCQLIKQYTSFAFQFSLWDS